MIILIIWDMFETYLKPSDRWKLVFEIGFSKTPAWKSVKMLFLAYCAFIKAFTTFLCLELKTLDACGQSIWQLYSRSSSSFRCRWLWRPWSIVQSHLCQKVEELWEYNCHILWPQVAKLFVSKHKKVVKAFIMAQ